MLYRTLGRTGEKVSPSASAVLTSAIRRRRKGIRIIRTAIDRGINFMDNCWDYHDGESEIRMGKALRDGYRDKVFLMTKIDGRRESRRRQTDRRIAEAVADRPHRSVQFHEIIRLEDPDRIFAKAARWRRARGEEGRQGSLHRLHRPQGPDCHLRMLEVAARN